MTKWLGNGVLLLGVEESTVVDCAVAVRDSRQLQAGFHLGTWRRCRAQALSTDMGAQALHSVFGRRSVVNRDEARKLPTVVDLPTAGRMLGIGRSAAYELVRASEWPTPVLRLGRLIRVPTAPLLELLGERQRPVA